MTTEVSHLLLLLFNDILDKDDILVLEEEYMDFMEKTNQYYSLWLGEEDILSNPFSGVRWVYSPERNQIQAGYSQPFDLYILCQPERTVLSYGGNISGAVDQIKKEIQTAGTVDEIEQGMVSAFGNRCCHFIKYVFDKPDKVRQTTSYARNLVPGEYPQFKNFFTTNHPGCKEADWLETYFMDLVERHLCCGLFHRDLLVSCSDAPAMPYMPDEVQEIGINTLEPYRGKGYAVQVCITCLKQMLQNGICPQWSTSVHNVASQRLAEKIGFVKYADVITVSL